MDKKLFGTRLKELRKENRITQKELAQKLDTTDKTIWAYENGKATPPLEMLLSYANLFQCSIDYLVGREDDLGNIVIQNDSELSLTLSEQTLLRDFRKLVPETQNYIIGIVQNLATAV